MPEHIRVDFETRIELFKHQPFHTSLNTHKLDGALGTSYAFYLRDGYRVIFDFLGDGIVLLINIGSHDDYRKWARS